MLAKIINVTKQFNKVYHIQRISKLSCGAKVANSIIYNFFWRFNLLSLSFSQTQVILDLGGNVRKNPKLSGTTHNVFGIQVGVSVVILVKKRQEI
jgi:hypothetical protein